MILVALRPLVDRAGLQRAKTRFTAVVSRRASRRLAPKPRSPSGPRRSLFTVNDVLTTLLLLHLRQVVKKKETDAWAAEALRLSQDLHSRFGKQLTPFTARIPARLEQLSGETMKDLSVRFYASYVLEELEVLSSALGHRQRYSLRLEGESRLQEALNQGKGAVLWCQPSFSSSLLVKAALASAGFEIHHLSRPGHNLSNTRYGVRFLNSIVRRAEGHYLAERIIVDEGSEVAASRRIMKLLKENRIVSVTVGNLGSQVVEAPVLDGVLRVATGAPHFALRSGAPLLPLHSYRNGEEYVVQIGEPIPLAGMSRDMASESAVRELACRLEDFVQAHPLDWSGWFRGIGTYSEPAHEP
jgi:lauroyl/myristoyl acyltransferase